MRNEAWELAEYQARQIVRGFGQPDSQESEVMAAASVGMLGLVLARTVLAAAELDRRAEELARMEVITRPVRVEIPQHIARMFGPEGNLSQLLATRLQAEEAAEPMVPDA